jgi:hypothetical protein
MGSKETYKEYFFANPGTFFLSSGWLEHAGHDDEGGVSQRFGLDKSIEYYTELYDEETAKYLVETLGSATANYKKMAFINTGAGAISDDRESTRLKAEEKGWEFEEITGDTSLIAGLLDGDWDEEKYLVVYPGSTIVPSHDELIVASG